MVPLYPLMQDSTIFLATLENTESCGKITDKDQTHSSQGQLSAVTQLRDNNSMYFHPCQWYVNNSHVYTT